MLEAGLEALATLLTADRIMWMWVGIFLGVFVGLLPGLGGVTGLALVLPFIYGMDPSSGIALMIGLMAVTSTSDTFPAVLIGVPGSGSSQASIMDGYPMAKKGQAGKALGAAFIASMLGGLIGAAVLFAILPIARPLILALGSPELFMLTLLGVTAVGVLAKGSPLHGLLMALLGFALSTVGSAPTTAEYRFTFDTLLLMAGVPLATLVLGMFALPELVDLARTGKSVSATAAPVEGAGLRAGALEAFRHKWLVLRSSLMGAVIGFIPGLGGSAASWFVYAQTVQTSKDKENFGKGDVRGLIGPEAANNAVDGGALIPTLLFGIPGSGSGAILLGGLILLGIQPGPGLASDEGLPIMFVVLWTLALANVFSTGLCFGLSRMMIKLSFLPGRVLAPFLIVLVCLASYQNSRSTGDLLMLFAFGLLGWIVKSLRWPRAPLLIGFVLGMPAERYLGITLQRFGWGWLTHPIVMVIALLCVVSVWGAVRRASNSLDSDDGQAAVPPPEATSGASRHDASDNED